MNKEFEKLLPRSYKPISGWGYFWRKVLYAIPVLGWIFLIIHAVAAQNRHTRSFARSYFCGLLLFAIIAVIVAALLVAAIATGFINFDEFAATYEQSMANFQSMI